MIKKLYKYVLRSHSSQDITLMKKYITKYLLLCLTVLIYTKWLPLHLYLACTQYSQDKTCKEIQLHEKIS